MEEEMTEQFSQEYIAFIRKAEGLQALWVPEEGDWIVTEDSELMGHDTMLQPYITCLKEDGEGGFVTLISTSYGRSTDYVEEIITEGAAPDEIKKRCAWLPTLFQLIGVIEGANEGRTHWRIFRMRDGRRKYTMTVHTFGKHEYSVNSDDLMLAAAQLAVRAVEEVE